MIREAVLILDSIDWLEKEIDKKLEAVDKATTVNDDFVLLDELEKQILKLLKKLQKEEENMNNYLIKYRKLINDEKKEILRNIK